MSDFRLPEIIDEEALKILRSKYALPPCRFMANGQVCQCEPKRFTFRACVWMGYKEARDFFPAMADTIEKLWLVMRAAEGLANTVEEMQNDHHEKLVEGQTLESASENWNKVLDKPLEFGPLLKALAPFRSEEKLWT